MCRPSKWSEHKTNQAQTAKVTVCSVSLKLASRLQINSLHIGAGGEGSCQFYHSPLDHTYQKKSVFTREHTL